MLRCCCVAQIDEALEKQQAGLAGYANVEPQIQRRERSQRLAAGERG